MAPHVKPGSAIMHFGMHKTGSSSIKASLLKNLSDERFHYIHLDGHASVSSNIATAFMDEPARFHVHVKLGASDEDLRALRDQSVASLRTELRAAGERSVILSSEVIGYLKEHELKRMCELIASEGPDPVAVGYVRRPKEFIESAFQQKVKGGLEAFSGPFNWGRVPNYPERLGQLEAVLGREAVRLWLFDPARFPDGCVVRDFCARLGIRLSPEDVLRVNEGISLPAISLLYIYRKFGPGYGVGSEAIRENRLLVDRVSTLPGPKLRLHSSVVAPAIRRRRDEIAWLEDRLGASMSEDLTAHDEHAIRSEEELLRFTPEALHWLAGELGPEFQARQRRDMNPAEVAEWMHALRRKLAAEDGQASRAGVKVAGWMRRLRRKLTGGDETPRTDAARVATEGREGAAMSTEELVRRARESMPGMGTLEDDEAQRLVREVFRHIRREIDATPEGKIGVAGLGQFLVKRAEPKTDGRKRPSRRVAFKSNGNG